MIRHRAGCFCGNALLIAAIVLIAGEVLAAEGAPVVGVEVRNLSAAPLTAVPITFGQAFKHGDIRDGVEVRLGDKVLPVQVDIKRRYDDGSVRFGVLSAIIDMLPAQPSQQFSTVTEMRTSRHPA